MVIRKHARYPVSWSVTIYQVGIEYRGTISDVSLKGCTVKSTTLRPFSGMQMRLSIDIKDGQAPLDIEKATIRWCSSDLIGIEFSRIGAHDQVRLIGLIQDLQDAVPQGSVSAKISQLEPSSVLLPTSHKANQPTILIVDDEEAILGVCASILERAGFRILKAADSFKALQICTAHQGEIDLLFTDLVLVPRGFRIATPDNPFPLVNGHELAVQASVMRPDLRVAFMSGNPDLDLAGYGIKRGSLPFIAKPFSIEELVAFVLEALGSEMAMPSRLEKLWSD